jgi:hypothetical protein
VPLSGKDVRDHIEEVLTEKTQWVCVDELVDELDEKGARDGCSPSRVLADPPGRASQSSDNRFPELGCTR